MVSTIILGQPPPTFVKTIGTNTATRNRVQPFFLMAMTCLNGAFQGLRNEALAEALLSAEGGAVAVWAASGLVNPAEQAKLHEAMLPQLLAGETLVEAALRAKSAIDDMDIRRTWILLGDPATRLRLP